MMTIQQQWESYLSDVMPKTASEIQIIECRRAFYAGAMGMMAVFKMIGDDGISEDAGVNILDGLNDELNGFAKGVGVDN